MTFQKRPDQEPIIAGTIVPAEQKVVVVTGASQGIGAGLVQGFRKIGYGVVANSRSIRRSALAGDPAILVVDGLGGDVVPLVGRVGFGHPADLPEGLAVLEHPQPRGLDLGLGQGAVVDVRLFGVARDDRHRSARFGLHQLAQILAQKAGGLTAVPEREQLDRRLGNVTQVQLSSQIPLIR